jgi:hypothetical protein
MIMIMDNGKTNQFGRIEYMAVMRHRDPLLCTMGQTALYLFYRWNTIHESPPQFSQRQDWYNLHLLKGESANKAISYETQLDWTKRIFTGANLHSLKKTHLGRSQGARHAEIAGVGEGQIRRAGRWNMDALSNCYLTHLPRKFVRSMAGFEPSNRGDYFIPRAKIQPPSSLIREVWPWVDEWLQWFKAHGQNDFSPAPGLITPVPEEEEQDDLAAQGFLRLLDQFRTIFLQDSVILRDLFPTHPIWTDPVFVREDYQEFAVQVKSCLSNIETPEEIQIRQTLPAIAQRLNVVRQDINQRLDELDIKQNQRLSSIDCQLLQQNVRLDEISESLQALLTGQVEFTVRARTGETGQAIEATRPDSSLIQSKSRSLPPEPSSQQIQASRTSEERLITFTVTSDTQLSEPPRYQLSRTITTVPELWREWTAGLGGYPSVQSLEDRYGAAWRPSQKERVFFCRRKVIIDEIRTRHAQGEAIPAAVEGVELVRRRAQLSLYALANLLQGGTKKRKRGVET